MGKANNVEEFEVGGRKQAREPLRVLRADKTENEEVEEDRKIASKPTLNRRNICAKKSRPSRRVEAHLWARPPIRV